MVDRTVISSMTDHNAHDGKARKGDHIVSAPARGDVIGRALQGAFPATTLPDDFKSLLGQIDRIVH